MDAFSDGGSEKDHFQLLQLLVKEEDVRQNDVLLGRGTGPAGKV